MNPSAPGRACARSRVGKGLRSSSYGFSRCNRPNRSRAACPPTAALRVPREGCGHKARVVTLHAQVGPGDAGEPVITIGFSEDF